MVIMHRGARFMRSLAAGDGRWRRACSHCTSLFLTSVFLIKPISFITQNMSYILRRVKLGAKRVCLIN